MNFITHGLTLLIGILILAFILHMRYLERTYSRIISLCKIQVSKDLLYRDLIASQGLNFNFLMATSWILFFMAFGYFYFLTPNYFSYYNYYNLLPEIASSSYGFCIFGLGNILFAIIFMEFVLRFQMVYIYGFYEISKAYKIILISAIPVLLFSLICSGYTGTIYPNPQAAIEMGAFLSLIISEVILLSPIFMATLEAQR